jgi:type VI secretion system protein ImpB
LKDRKFVQIDRDNFDAVMASMTPGLRLKVENTLADDGSELALDLEFKSIEDFSPVNLVQQIAPLRKLYETREKLKELQSASELGVGAADEASGAGDTAADAEPQGGAE